MVRSDQVDPQRQLAAAIVAACEEIRAGALHDQFVVDVGDHPVAVGDEAMLFGDPTLGAPAVEEWADSAGTINYEIVTRIGPRVARREVTR